MTLLQMQYVKAVCQFGNVTRAAEELSVSRPAVSRVLSELEKELGVTLFWRSPTGLVLTDSGAIFYESCTEILNRVEALEKRMQLIGKKAEENIVKVGIIPATGVIIFPQFYSDFYSDHPDIKLKVIENRFDRSIKMLSDGELDAVITSDDTCDKKQYGCKHLFDTELVFCVSKDHRLAKKDFVGIEDIKNEPLIYMEKNMQRETEITDLFTSIGLAPHIILRTSQIGLIKRITMDGSASAVQIKGAIDDGEDIIGIPFMPKIPLKISIKWKYSSENSKGFRIFLDYVNNYNFAV